VDLSARKVAASGLQVARNTAFNRQSNLRTRASMNNRPTGESGQPD
jgi:hypothetical protein